MEEDMNPASPTDSSRTSDNSSNITRVHFTPNFADLINRIENNSQADSSSLDVSIDLKNELGTCLEKLRQDANAILALTVNMQKIEEDTTTRTPQRTTDENIISLKRQLINECQTKESFKQQLDDAIRYVDVLEKEKVALEEQLEQLIAKEKIMETELVQVRCKIAELLESRGKEVVSEGYGEHGTSLSETGDSVQLLVELQEKARSMLAQSRASADPTLLSLIEQLCLVGEKIKDESRKEKEDMLQQIDVADKKYRTTQKFLDEQAMERELERDEAQKKINVLHEQLRERGKDRNSCERAMAEVNLECSMICTKKQVEQLEQQLQEMTRALSEEVQHRKETEAEYNEAVDKIKVLRDIIRELEHQSETNAAVLEDYEVKIHKLQQCLLDFQGTKDIGKADDSTKEVADVAELYKHIDHLENEVQRLRAYSELVGSEGALNEIKKQLSDLDTQLEKKTKGLETLHSTGNTNCSSPSEDISVRDIVRSDSVIMEECEVPLQQLARLKEKLIRHSRAEDTAIKRIKDLEMQVLSLKNEMEEATHEKDYMKKQIQEQLVLISDFQIRLDEQRIISERIEKETNTSLEHKIYDMQNEIVSLQDKLNAKEKALSHQRVLLQETQEQVRKLEDELASTKDDEIIVEMQKEVENLRSENAAMKAKIEKDKSIVPNLVENIISDKNTDIEKLRDRLHSTEKMLETYTSLNLDLGELVRLSQLKSNGTTLEHMISSIDMSGPEQVRRADYHQFSDEYSNSEPLLRSGKSMDHTLLEPPEISAIMGPNQVPLQVSCKNSTEIRNKKVHFEDVEALRQEVRDLQNELAAKDELTAEYKVRLQLLDNLEKKIEKLQMTLDETEKALARATDTFQKEQKESEEREKDLGVDLAESKFKLTQALNQIEILEQDSKRKDDMCMTLTREKQQLESALQSARNENFSGILSSKDNEIVNLQYSLEEKTGQLERLITEHGNCAKEIEILHKQRKQITSELSDCKREMENLRDKLKRKHKSFKEQTFTVEKMEREIESLGGENQRLREFLKQREEEAAEAVKQSKQCEKELLLCEKEVLEIREENKNVSAAMAQIQKAIDNKDKVIKQMEEDYKKVHSNLLMVKQKMKEAGNVHDLMARLKEEQLRSEKYVDQMHDLKIELMQYKNEAATSVEDITDKLKRELDYSEQIDTNILTAVSDHSLNSVTDTPDVETYRRELAKEKEANKGYMLTISKLERKNAQLWELIEREKNAVENIKKMDRDLMDKMKLELQAAQAKENQLNDLLEELRKRCKQLQSQVKKHKGSTNSQHTESTEYKSLPSMLNMELYHLKGEHEALKFEKQNLTERVAHLQELLAGRENELKCAQDMLTTEMLRFKSLHEKMEGMAQEDNELRVQIARKDGDIQRIIAEKEDMKAVFAKEKNKLLQLLKSSPGADAQGYTSAPATDVMLNHLKELNGALLDNRKLMLEIQKLSAEKRSLRKELERLHTKGVNNVHLGEITDRADYLFAKTLRYESVNKALVWQKRYLINYLCGHQKHCALSSVRDPLANVRTLEGSNNVSPISKFRRAVNVLIAISRMKYLVLRWHSGIRRAEQVNMWHYKNHTRQYKATTTATAPNTQFQVGQPVSSQIFGRVIATNLFESEQHTGENRDTSVNRAEEECWSGQSPPCRDRRTETDGASGCDTQRMDETGTLHVPHLMNKFGDRINQIHDHLQLILSHNKDTQGS